METETNVYADHREATRLLEELVIRRRATPHFTAEPVPTEVIDNALAIASQAPSGYNFQPWRFLVLTEPEQRIRLKKVALNQEKIGEAPVVIIAFGEKEGWKTRADEIYRERAATTGQTNWAQVTVAKEKAVDFVSTIPSSVWINRHVMIAFTYLMLAIEAQGWDTAPMEGFDGPAVRAAFDLPADAEVVALLAIGRAASDEPPHPGRLPVSEIAYFNRFGKTITPSFNLNHEY